ncbi:MAG TPA: integrase core domain-containing protein [Ktedonobacteraceae bacterium]
MEEEWMRDRALLADLLQETPSASPRTLAQIIGRSVRWVKKWRKRLVEGDPSDPSLLCSYSRAHHAPYFRWDFRVTQRMVEMRLSPPENLKRVPGPRALLSYLPRDPELQAAQVPLPRCNRTIWKLLHATGCLAPRSKEPPSPTDLRKPLEEIQMDFKEVSTVSPEQSSQGKRQHVVEVCNCVDAATSIALSAQAREDFHEQTALEAVITFLRPYGRPQQMTFDRDPRWGGGASGRDFPSPLRRLLFCLGVKPHVCAPHRPDTNAFVERFHRTYGQECLQVHHPSTLQEVREVTEAFLQHSNDERPHQGRACGNIPPRVAFPTLPTLPALPERVAPDAWVVSLDQKMYLRHVGRDGCVDVDLATSSVGSQLAGRTILLPVRAEQHQFAVWSQDQVVKLLPMKGLVGQEMALDDDLPYITQEALAAPRRASARSSRKVRQPSLWGDGTCFALPC